MIPFAFAGPIHSVETAARATSLSSLALSHYISPASLAFPTRGPTATFLFFLPSAVGITTQSKKSRQHANILSATARFCAEIEQEFGVIRTEARNGASS
jgi:hypothetical protein